MNISDEVIDAIRELITIGVGHSAGMINKLGRNHVTLTVPEVSITEGSFDNSIRLLTRSLCQESTSRVVLDFKGELTGSMSLVIPYESALNLVIILSGEEGSSDEMDILRIETLLEVANIIISSVMSAMNILVSSRLSFQFPYYQNEYIDGECLIEKYSSEYNINAKIRFKVQEKEIEGIIELILTRQSFEHLIFRILSVMEKGI